MRDDGRVTKRDDAAECAKAGSTPASRSVNIYEYQPEHIGDRILAGVLVRDIETVVLSVYMTPVSVAWSWRLDQKPGALYSGPYDKQENRIVGVTTPPTSSEVLADIEAWIVECKGQGSLREDAFE